MNTVNDIRLQKFCQFKNEIRGSTEYLVVGLDIAKEKHNAFFGTATRTRSKTCSSCEQNLRRILSQKRLAL